MIRLARSSGYSPLDEAAQEAVARWRFEPAREGEQAVSEAGQKRHKRLAAETEEKRATLEFADVVEALNVAAQGREGKPGDAKGKVDEKQQGFDDPGRMG